MNRKLTAKAQQIKPNIPASVKSFSDILIIEPDNQNLMLKKGTIYTVFDVSASTELNSQVVSKLIYDTIHDAYYQSDNISPIQSLERAISAVKERVAKMAATEFNILSGVLWGNVMYVVQYGKAASYLIRSGETRHINANSEGNFSAASGVVKDEDVIVFCTKEFSNQYPTEKLLNTSVQSEGLPFEASCLILKFVVDTTFTETENIDFGIKPVKKSSGPNPLLAFFKKTEKKAPVSQPQIQPDVAVPTTPVKLRLPSKIKITPILIIVVTTALLLISVTYTLTKKKPAQEKKEEQTEMAQESSESTNEIETPQVATGFEESTKTQRVSPSVLYDIRIADSIANPTDIIILGNTLVVTDKNTGKIYTSSATTPKFTALANTYARIDNLNTVGDTLNFTDGEGYKSYDLNTQKATDSYQQPNLGVTNAYLDFVYAISGDTIVKYSKESGKLTASTWAQNADFSNARALSIAVSIFVLRDDGSLVSYTRGTKDTFSVTGLEQPFSSPQQIVTDVDWDNLYIADTGNKRVVVLKKDGSFVKQFKTTSEDAWNDIRSITISTDEKKLYVLNGSKVYEVTL